MKKNMIKKIAAGLIICTMVMGTAGCGQATTADTQTESAEDAQTAESGSVEETKKADTEPAINFESAKVSYLGPEGTYTQEACGVFFNDKGKYLPYETVDDAVNALLEGKSEYSVIPQENTIGGAVTEYLDIVIGKQGLSVVGEVELPINQNLLAMAGADVSDIKKIYSHKQGITQGKEWLEKNVPDAEIVEVSSTAEGARITAEDGDKSQAAIASAACANVYHLDILAAGIQNNDSNKTRFYVLSTDKPSEGNHDRLAFIASGKAEDLPKLMEEMKDQDMTLVAVHDRPEMTELGRYNYMVECADSTYDNYKKLEEDQKFSFRYLGSFDVREDSE